MTTALFPGSFDPITNGHLDVIKQASQIFDQVHVVVMTNTHKKYMFDDQQRLDLVQDSIKEFKNVDGLLAPETLTVNLARKFRVKTIIRGVRNSEDFLYEQQIAGMNKKLAPEISTVLFFTSPENSFVASSIIKEIAKFNGDITSFLPEKAAQALKDRMNNND